MEELCASSEMSACFDGLTGSELVSALQAAGAVRRRLDAVVTGLVGQVEDRDRRLSAERVSSTVGCRDVTELLRRSLRTDMGTARQFVRAARVTHRDVVLSTGDLLPARYPAMAEALRDGVVSVPGLLAAIGPVERAGNRIRSEEREAVDGLLAATAHGEDLPDEHGRPGPAPSTDELAEYARAIMLALDPDGAEPDDAKADRNRSFWMGPLRGGVHPIGGGLIPEVAGLLQRLLDGLNNPAAGRSPDLGSDTVNPGSDADRPERSPNVGGVRFEPDGDPDGEDPGGIDGLPVPEDRRTRTQRDHDNLAMILTAAASGGVPDLGGAAPTLVVSVTAEAYASGHGRAFIEGTGDDVPLSVAHHAACAGGIQRVLFDERGQIVSIGTTARIFTALQRRAIQLRDRECIIPGCHVPATWCEIHHVQEWADGGPTHTSNVASR
ncbi:HNH endonuclease signature motif containing protein [Microbacterium sp. 8M]|uniref:HNH endonuclease signature motif containing protein n=1 Tax=Microbacterium sp. 8M TaxID=2653153 RepID=UPI00135B4157|nr:HNH endonuclease signature motif containing protein [Microbacterium sp. 8M]